jgi:hypothetical protein
MTAVNDGARGDKRKANDVGRCPVCGNACQPPAALGAVLAMAERAARKGYDLDPHDVLEALGGAS